MDAKRPTPDQRKKFDLDLRAGEDWEHSFLGLLVNGKVECKRDRMTRKTGNLFIEYRCHNEASGIATTDAAWWVIGIEGPTGDVETAVLASVEWLKETCGRLYKAGRIVRGGDDNASDGVLLPIASVAIGGSGRMK